MPIVLDCTEDSTLQAVIDALCQINLQFPVLALTNGTAKPFPPSVPTHVTQTPGRQSAVLQWLDACHFGEEPDVSSQASTDTTIVHAPVRVLVVEDTPVIQKALVLQLKAIGAEVCTADDGKEALDHLQHCWHPLIFMDYHMPEVDGVECTSRIRKHEASGAFPGRPPILIVALTADTLSTTQEVFEWAGADACIHKPARTPQLLEWYNRAGGAAAAAAAVASSSTTK